MYRCGLAFALTFSMLGAVAAQETPPRVQRIDVVGASVLPSEQLAQLARTMLQGHPADPERVRRALDAIRDAYRQRGYTLAQVTSYQLDPQGNFQLTIAEGRIRRILYQGNQRTKSSVLHEALSLREGMVYQETKVREDRARLARLGIFSEVVITGRVPEEADRDLLGLVDLVVRVKEAQTGNVAATVGYSDQTGLVGFVNLSENNLFGTGQRLAAQWQRFGRVVLQDNGSLSQDPPRTAFDITFQRLALGPKSLIYGGSAYDQNTIFLPTFGSPIETLRSYERRKGGSAFLGRSFGKSGSVTLTGRRDLVGYDAVPDRLSPPLSELSRAQATVAALGLTVQTDTRDRADNPRQGGISRLRLESAGPAFGGDRRFSQATLDLRRYTPLSLQKKPEAALAFRFLGGTSTGDVPLSEQFFLGGFELLRGYEFFSIRGDRMALGSAEARIPLGGDTAGVLFVDAGNAWLPGQSVSLSGVKASVGAGLRFQSPVGPIRFDVAFGNQLRSYISLGQSF